MSTVEIAGRLCEVRDLTTGDRGALIALHTEVFGPGASEAWYRWKYEQGGGTGTGVWHEGRLIAHCGGIPRALWIEGQRRTGVQIGDVMVTPPWRGVLTRRGPFFHASDSFYGRHVGPGADHAVAFGFPSERHLRLAVKTGLLWDGGPVHALSWDAAGCALGWAWRWEPLAPSSPSFDAAVSTAWERMRSACGGTTLGERDARYVRWRFFERPGARCAAFVLRRLGSPRIRGVALLGLTTPVAQWLDWIGAPSDLPVAARGCRAAAAAAGATHLSAWATPAVRKSLQGSDIVAENIAAWVGIPRRSDISAERLGALSWWLMGGDTDFL